MWLTVAVRHAHVPTPTICHCKWCGGERERMRENRSFGITDRMEYKPVDRGWCSMFVHLPLKEFAMSRTRRCVQRWPYCTFGRRCTSNFRINVWLIFIIFAYWRQYQRWTNVRFSLLSLWIQRKENIVSAKQSKVHPHKIEWKWRLLCWTIHTSAS